MTPTKDQETSVDLINKTKTLIIFGESLLQENSFNFIEFVTFKELKEGNRENQKIREKRSKNSKQIIFFCKMCYIY